MSKDSALSVLINDNNRVVNQAIYNGAFNTSDPERVQVNIRSMGKLGIISGFQSPFDSERSVVSLIATNNAAYP
ncbi:cellulose biosynthesis cyclic di-GMP-binding regulatory protein BcsB, partial [Streptomyces scabiei]